MRTPRASILLVDDRPGNIVALEAILEPLGHELVAAGSGEEALRQLLLRDFALILLDVQMPNLDGFQTAELVKARERTRHIPIIFLTAISKDSAHVFNGYSAGAVDYLLKPFDPDVLRSKVKVFVDLWQKTRQLQEQAELLRDAEVRAAVRESEERYSALAEAMPQLVWRADSAGELQYVNDRWYWYTGQTPEQAVGAGWLAALHPEARARAVAAWSRSVATGEPYELEYSIRAADGTYRWFLARGLPIRDEHGRVVEWVGTCTDIDDQRRARESQRFLFEAGALLGASLDYRETLAAVARAAVPAVADWAVVDVVDEDGSLRQLALAHVDPVRRQFARELRERYPPQADAPAGPARVVRTGVSEHVEEIPPELLEASAQDEMHLALLRQLELKSYICVPLRVRDRVLGAITLVLAESGRRYGADDLALAEELARRAAMAIENAELYREAERRARAARVLETVGDGVVMVDGQSVVQLWNPAAETITGVPASAALGRPIHELIADWNDIAARIPVATAGPGVTVRAETVPVEIGGRERWISGSGVGFAEGTVYAFRDLTEERALEAMKSDFVATVSHELRTPLAAIHGSALTVLRKDLQLQDEIRDRLLEIIAEESDRLAEIVDDLLLASHLDSGKLQVKIESCDARMLAASVVDAAATHLPDGVTVELLSPPELPEVAADAGQLTQVLTNLVDNAIKYSPDGGLVTLELERVDANLRFSVRDRGLGIPAGEQRRIFEKFYRVDPNMTRGIGGTGLGLYIVRELVRNMGGRVSVESEVGRGTTFAIDIPVASPRRRATRRKQPAGAS